jgi:hypothetical protein
MLREILITSAIRDWLRLSRLKIWEISRNCSNNRKTYALYKSKLAEKILVNWDQYMPRFVKVIPFEYKKVLQEIKLEKIRTKLEMTEDTPQHQY